MFSSKHQDWRDLSIHSPISLCSRSLGVIIAVVLLLAFVERPSSLSISSDPRYRSVAWEPPCGFTESIEMICLVLFSLDLAVKVPVHTSNMKTIFAQNVKKTINILVRHPFPVHYCNIISTVSKRS